jgi:hypothetical protein
MSRASNPDNGRYRYKDVTVTYWNDAEASASFMHITFPLTCSGSVSHQREFPVCSDIRFQPRAVMSAAVVEGDGEGAMDLESAALVANADGTCGVRIILSSQGQGRSARGRSPGEFAAASEASLILAGSSVDDADSGGR